MAFIFDINERFYKTVSASSQETQDYTPADGAEFILVNAGLSSSSAPDTNVCLIWDADGTPELVMSSYSEIVHTNVNKTYVGDGSKVMRICLTNDLTEQAYLGGYWQGEVTS